MKSRGICWKMGFVLGAFLSCGIAAAQDPSLIVYLNFDEGKGDKAADRSGKNNHPVFKGKAAFGEGKYGPGLALGTGAHLEVPHNDILNLQSMTLMCWVRFLGDTGDHQSAMEKGSAWKEGEYNLLGDYNNHVLLQIRDLPEECNDEIEGGDVMDGKWHHVAGTFDGKAIVVYADGKVVKQGPCVGKLLTNKDPLFIGARGGASRWTNGFYDDIKVYNRALTAAEIAKAMELIPTPVQPRDRATVLWAALKSNVTR